MTVPLEGKLAGAVYKPFVEIVPILSFPPAVPFTCHVTAVFEFPETTAVNCCDSPVDTVAPVGDTQRLSAPEVTTIVLEDEAVLLALE